MDTSRIKKLAKAQGKTLSYICGLIGREVYYLNDLEKSSTEMSLDDLRVIANNLDTTVEYLRGETDDPNFHLSSVGLEVLPYEGRGVRPVYGHASAGLGVLAEQESLGMEPVAPQYDTDEYFWLKVSGDSMSPMLVDGDLVLIHRDAPLESGTLMVVIVDDSEGFIKRVSVDEDTVWLHSYNPYYPPRSFDGVDLARLRFVGRVVEQKRKSFKW